MNNKIEEPKKREALLEYMSLHHKSKRFRDRRKRKAKERKNDWRKEIY